MIGSATDLNFDRRTFIKLCHALNFLECNIRAVLKSVSCLVQTSYYRLLVFSYTGHHDAYRRLSVSVYNLKLGAKVAEYLQK